MNYLSIMIHRARCTCAVVAGVVAAVVAWPASAGAEDIVSFTSPSANIGCVMDSSSVRCDIADRTWSPPPRPADCPSIVDFGQGIQLGAGQSPRFVCAGDTALNQGPPLAYGDTVTRGSLECESTPSGMSCWDFQYGGSFEISREGYQLS